MEKILKKITECRRERGFTFENIGLELGITMAAYRKIEIGETKLTVERLFKISKILNLPITDFIVLHSEYSNGNLKKEFSLDDKDFVKQLLDSKDEQIFLLRERERERYRERGIKNKYQTINFEPKYAIS